MNQTPIATCVDILTTAAAERDRLKAVVDDLVTVLRLIEDAHVNCPDLPSDPSSLAQMTLHQVRVAIERAKP